MYATNGLTDIIGIPASDLCGKSFYYCIQENCLRDAVKCLESAKANDSIAYLRFWFRDPRQDNQIDHDEHMSDGHSSGDEDDGGVHLSELMDHEPSETAIYSDSSTSMRSSVERDQNHNHPIDPNSRTSSGHSTDLGANNEEAIFDQPEGPQQSRTSSISTPDDSRSSNVSWSRENSQIELEAVVSCTSDGLVVILRRAKPAVCHMPQPLGAAQHPYANGCFASPWASDPILPNTQDRLHYSLPHLQQPSRQPIHPTAGEANAAASRGPASEDFMNTIRDVAVFAWALTGINGSLERYGRGTPSGESQPPGGLPVWDPNSSAGIEPDRPIGGAYLNENQEYDMTTEKQRRERFAPTSVHHPNKQDQMGGYVDYSGHNGGHIYDPRNGGLYHSSNGDYQSNGFSNGLQNANQQGGLQQSNQSTYPYVNGSHDSHSRSDIPTQAMERQPMWNNLSQVEQGAKNTNGHQDNGRSFG